MTRTLSRAAALLALALLSGCASNTPALDSQFGVAVAEARKAQILNPKAPHTLAIVGMDGQAGKSAYESYQKSYKAPEPQTGALSIGVAK